MNETKLKWHNDSRTIAELDIIKWGEWFEASGERQMWSDKTRDILISTVFLGLDLGVNEEGLPLLFETMIFAGEHKGYQERYSNAKEAKGGHVKAVKLVKASPLNI